MRCLLILMCAALLSSCAGPRDPATGAATYADGIANSADTVDLHIGNSYQRLRILRPATPEKAVLVLLTGGDGHLDIRADGTIRLAGNFLVRTREQWAAQGFLVIIPDTPADRPSLFRYRLSDGYRAILQGIAAHARSLSDKPIWLMGTSAGTPGALFGAASLGDLVHGAAVSSAITLPSGNDPETVFAVGLDRIRQPVLIQYHTEDGCFVTPPGNVARIQAGLTAARAVELQSFSGGLPPASTPCEARAQHGFYGIEGRVVEAASSWMLAH
jgi:hypothetical protein